MYLTIAHVAFAYGFDDTKVVKTLDPNTYYLGNINPHLRFLNFNSIEEYEDRYDVPFVNKGTVVGERFSSDILVDLKNHPDNPLDLDPSFDPYHFEANNDCKIIVDFWDRFIGPLHDSLFPDQVPPVDPPVDPPIDPVDPPEDPPVPVPPVKVYPAVPISFINWLKKGEGKLLLGAAYKEKLKTIREWLEAYESLRKS